MDTEYNIRGKNSTRNQQDILDNAVSVSEGQEILSIRLGGAYKSFGLG